MKQILYFMFIICVLSCNKPKQENIEKPIIKVDTTKIVKTDISKIKYIDYGIDQKAKNVLNSWQAYTTLEDAIHSIKDANFEFFTKDNALFLSTLKDLENTIPEEINTSPIQARLLILKTKLFKLEDLLSLSTTQKQEKLIAIKELLEAFSIVTLQINKKFEKEAQNIIKPTEI